MKWTLACLICLFSVIGCTSRQVPSTHLNTAGAVIRHTDQIGLLRSHIATISENNTFPRLTNALRKSMHNPHRFEFIRGEYQLQETTHKRLSGTHITYHYVIRIHYRGENAFGALRTATQDFHLYPDGEIHIPKK